MVAEHAPNDRYAEFLRDLTDKLAELLCQRGLSPEDAQLVSGQVAEWVSERWGGQKVYVKVAARSPRKGRRHK